MKKTIMALLIGISSINASEIPVLKAGQTVSADQLNEIFALLNTSNPEVKAADLVGGSYVCTNYRLSSPN